MKRKMSSGPFLNAVTAQVRNPEESLTGEKPKDMLPKKKGDVPGKGLMYVDIKVNRTAIRAMVDTGTTHNYISSIKVERLGLTLEKGCGRVKAINSAAQPVAGIAKFVLIKIGPIRRKDQLFGKSPRAISFSEEWRQNINLAHSYLEKAARRIKKHADKSRRSQEFNVGDKVMVKLLPQDRKFLRGRDSRLLQKYEGPLTIVKKIGKMAYKVDPPHWWSHQLYLVFHVSMLKPFYEDTADPSKGQIRRQSLKPKAAGKRVAEAILNDRVITASCKRHREYLVKWLVDGFGGNSTHFAHNNKPRDGKNNMVTCQLAGMLVWQCRTAELEDIYRWTESPPAPASLDDPNHTLWTHCLRTCACGNDVDVFGFGLLPGAPTFVT
ncbi:hypothetical protein RJ639_003225 [Escallonia herrerae]|uniref:Tf2-1-like SH3-like domain-containing protein n=1 Tax=Escallonia herrerae TaxID=1293975 RepID=A0AA89AWT9_9ASTE|nr:hypothetical protein RJ639_003225 [Escallonia herrerae]